MAPGIGDEGPVAVSGSRGQGLGVSNGSQELLRKLAGHEGGPCVSIYVPTHRPGPEMFEEDPLRFRHALDRARDGLQGRLGRDEAAEILAPVAGLPDDPGFWKERKDGLAVFLAPGFDLVRDLPYTPIETVEVGNHFHLSPLLRLAQDDERFHLLALSQNQVRLLECGRGGCRTVDLGDIPASRGEALSYDDHERQLQSHTSEPASGAEIFHGHGMGGEWHEDERVRFLQRVARGVDQRLSGDTAPLLLACVESEASPLRDAVRYPYLLDGLVAGNPDHLTEHELHERAWPLVEEQLHARHRRAAERVAERRGSPEVAEGIESILPAAASGRIHQLLLVEAARVPGIFDVSTMEVSVGPDAETDERGEDLVNRAVLETLRHAGSAMALPAEVVPSQHQVVALLRYAG